LCRLYNKKNNPNEIIIIPEDNNNNHHLHPASPLQKENSFSKKSDSFDSNERSQGEFGGNFEGDVMFSPESLTQVKDGSDHTNMGLLERLMQKEDNDDYGNDWLDGFSLEDLHHCLEAMPPTNDLYEKPMNYHNPNQQHFSDWF